MTESKTEYLLLRTPDEEVYANCWVVEDTAGLNAQCYLYGPKKGDDIFALVQQKLQEISNKHRLPLRHIYTASNKGSLALVERTEGYTLSRKDRNDNNIFEKIYTPVENDHVLV